MERFTILGAQNPSIHFELHVRARSKMLIDRFWGSKIAKCYVGMPKIGNLVVPAFHLEIEKNCSSF